MTSGTEVAVYTSEASDSNNLLEKILPDSVSEYIELIKAHIVAGQTNRFVARQLLLLGSMLDFSDATNRKVAAVFVLDLLNSPLQHEVDDDGNKVVIGDGISLGGEPDWADVVSGLAKKVHATLDALSFCHQSSFGTRKIFSFEPAELLHSLLLPGVCCEYCPSAYRSVDIDEKSIRTEKPKELVMALAKAKTDTIVSKLQTSDDPEKDAKP